MADTTIGTVNRLVALCRDGEEFYGLAAGKAEDGRLKEMFNEMARLHREVGSDLRPHVAKAGGSPSEGGTMGGKVRQMFGSLKATFTSDTDRTLTAELDEAEEGVLTAFRQALDEPISEEAKAVVAEKLKLLEASRERMKALQPGASR